MRHRTWSAIVMCSYARGQRHTWGTSPQQHTEFPTACRRPEFPHGSGLHLPYTFTGEPKGLPNLLEGSLAPIRHPASLPKNLPFSGRERLQERLGPLARLVAARDIERRVHLLIREGVAEQTIAIGPDRRLERDRVLRDVPGV